MAQQMTTKTVTSGAWVRLDCGIPGHDLTVVTDQPIDIANVTGATTGVGSQSARFAAGASIKFSELGNPQQAPSVWGKAVGTSATVALVADKVNSGAFTWPST